MELIIVILVLAWCGISKLIENYKISYNNNVWHEFDEEFLRDHGFLPRTNYKRESSIKIAVNKQAIHENWGGDWERINNEVDRRCEEEHFLSSRMYRQITNSVIANRMMHFK